MSDTPEKKAADFDRVLLAMDVVDTLRHQKSLVERELSAAADDGLLVDKVKRMYAAQGLEVSESLIAEAVAALREGRFTYRRPPAPSWKLALARLYVNRRRWFKAISVLAVLLAIIGVGYWFVMVRPETRRLEEITSLRQALLSDAKEPQVRAQVEGLFAEAKKAAERGDSQAGQKAAAQLSRLAEQVRLSYELRVVSREGVPSGVWRIPDVNTGARNYYVIVEAVGSDGRRLKLPILNEEDNRTELVEMWGLRVDGAVFEKIRRDKADDGIIQNNRFGVKKPGYLLPEYRFPTTGGAITHW
ncbi:MAG: hypothetical protein GXY54_11500 [Deltaproteobacteria bacterium]|nr:hypothetical protein [Deltaproteobacteria bacterium]